MRNLLALALAINCLASQAFAEAIFSCSNQNQVVARLTISDPITKRGSYNACNGGVGDEMRDCHSYEYETQIQEASIALSIDGTEVQSHMELGLTGSEIYGYDILKHKDKAIHVTLRGLSDYPYIKVRVMAKGAPGNPVEVGSYSLSCKVLFSLNE